MDKRLEQQLEKLISGIQDYQMTFHPKSALDPHRVILDFSYQGITEQTTRSERLITARKGKVAEIAIARHRETKMDYGDNRHQIEKGESIQDHLKGDEEAIIIVRSEFTTRPKGPHGGVKTIEVYE
jgi:hypothetical protein